MNTDELLQQIALADGLLQKLERIHALWSELPSEDDLLVMVNLAERLVKAMELAKEISLSDDFPSSDSLEPTVDAAAAIARNLEKAAETEVDLP